MLPLMPRTTEKVIGSFTGSLIQAAHSKCIFPMPKNVLYLGLEINGSSRETAGSGEDPGSEICVINPGKWAWNDANGKSLLNTGWECGCSPWILGFGGQGGAGGGFLPSGFFLLT